MSQYTRMLNIVKLIGGTVLTIGIILFALGSIVSGYNALIPLGIGTIVGAGTIFIMGIFFVATEEILHRSANRG